MRKNICNYLVDYKYEPVVWALFVTLIYGVGFSQMFGLYPAFDEMLFRLKHLEMLVFLLSIIFGVLRYRQTEMLKRINQLEDRVIDSQQS